MYDAIKRSSFNAIWQWTQCIIIWKESAKQIGTNTWKWNGQTKLGLQDLDERRRISPANFSAANKLGDPSTIEQKRELVLSVVEERSKWNEAKRDIWIFEWNQRRSFVDWWLIKDFRCERDFFRVCWAKMESEVASLSAGKFPSLRTLWVLGPAMGFDISFVCYSCIFILEFLGQQNCHRL